MVSNGDDVDGEDEAEEAAGGEGAPDGEPEHPPTAADERRSPGADEQYCSSCGEVIKKEAEICPECGVRQSGPASASGKDRTTAGILALLLGGIGAHKFYLGETGMGIIYLCFSWTLIPAIVAFIEGIIYLTKSDEEFQRKYVNE